MSHILNPYRYPTPVNGTWEKVGDVTVTDGTSMVVDNISTDYEFLHIMTYQRPNGTYDQYGNSTNPIYIGAQFNDDNGANYASTNWYSGTTTTTATSEVSYHAGYASAGYRSMNSFILSNRSGKPKMGSAMSMVSGSAGGNYSPYGNPLTGASKWTGTDKITKITIPFTENSLGTQNGHGRMIVLGYNPNATEATEFWEEQSYSELGASQTSSDLDSGAYTTDCDFYRILFRIKNGSFRPAIQFATNNDATQLYPSYGWGNRGSTFVYNQGASSMSLNGIGNGSGYSGETCGYMYVINSNSDFGDNISWMYGDSVGTGGNASGGYYYRGKIETSASIGRHHIVNNNGGFGFSASGTMEAYTQVRVWGGS